MDHGGRQRGGWTDQCSETDPGAVQPARDGRVRHSYPYRSAPQQDLSQLQTTNPTPFDLCRRTAREDCLITSREKLQFFVAEEPLAAGVAARGRPWRARRGRLSRPSRLLCPPKGSTPLSSHGPCRYA